MEWLKSPNHLRGKKRSSKPHKLEGKNRFRGWVKVFNLNTRHRCRATKFWATLSKPIPEPGKRTIKTKVQVRASRTRERIRWNIKGKSRSLIGLMWRLWLELRITSTLLSLTLSVIITEMNMSPLRRRNPLSKLKRDLKVRKICRLRTFDRVKNCLKSYTTRKPTEVRAETDLCPRNLR